VTSGSAKAFGVDPRPGAHDAPDVRDGLWSARLELLECAGDGADYSIREILSLALQQAAAGLRALGGLAYLAAAEDAGRLELAASTGLPSGIIDPFRSLQQGEVSARAAATGDVAWGPLVGSVPGAAGVLAVPVPGPAQDRPVGVLAFFTTTPEEPAPGQRELLWSVAGWAATLLASRREGRGASAYPRRPGGAGALSPAEQVLYMGELTASLATAATSRDIVRAIAEHVVPPIGADGLIVYAVESGRLKVVGSVGYDEAFRTRMEGSTLSSSTIVSQVLRGRTPLFAETADWLISRFPNDRDNVEASHKNSWALLPLIAAGTAIGCCVISFTTPRRFSDADRTLLIALSGLVAHALERARLYDMEHSRAKKLQRGLLPDALPPLPAATVAVRYLPAVRHAEAGGDWYDAIALSADQVGLIVGDVMGHGITEAATMGRIRTAVRTLAELEMPPAEILARVNALVSEFGDDSYATCLYSVFDPVSRRLSVCRAGSLPPLIVDPAGTVRRLSLETDPPLGATRPPFESSELELPEESLLVLYTDGLIDSSRGDADQELLRLERVIREEVARRPFATSDTSRSQERLEELCDAVVQTMLPDPEQMTDDAVLLIAHTRGTPADGIGFHVLADDATAAREARVYAQALLAQWGLEEVEYETELIVSELVGNAIRHARGPIRLRLIRSRSLICEVYDGSLTTPHIRRAAETDEGGRGLQLVAALSQRWGTRYLRDGKCIWAEQNLPSRV